MLPAAARMRRPAEFAAAVRSGTRAGSRAVTVHVAHDAGAHDPQAHDGAHPGVRVGFVVGRSVGSAVVRNRVRRRLRHLMRTRLAGLPSGSSVVVRAQPSAAVMLSATLAAELDRALHKALGRRP